MAVEKLLLNVVSSFNEAVVAVLVLS